MRITIFCPRHPNLNAYPLISISHPLTRLTKSKIQALIFVFKNKALASRRTNFPRNVVLVSDYQLSDSVAERIVNDSVRRYFAKQARAPATGFPPNNLIVLVQTAGRRTI